GENGRHARACLDLLLYPALYPQSLELHGSQFRRSRADRPRAEPDRTHACGEWHHAGRTRVTAARRKMGRYTGTIALLLLIAPAAPAEYTALDVQNVPMWGDPSSAVVHVTVPDRVEEASCNALVADAGMGGIGASLALAARGHSVCLTDIRESRRILARARVSEQDIIEDYQSG